MTFLLRDIPDDLWPKVKAKAALNKESIKDALICLLKQYVKS